MSKTEDTLETSERETRQSEPDEDSIRQRVEEQKKKNQAAIELLRSWRDEGDEEEQRETWEFLKKALDEDRWSYRKLFPEEENS
jgi:uncharacterized protein YchJ